MKAALAATVLLLVAGPAAAEEGRAEGALKKGATSLEIGVDTFGSSGFTGEIAARRHFSPGWAVRLAGSLGTDDSHLDNLDFNDGAVYPGSLESDATSWSLATQAVWFPVRRDDVALLFALGPRYSRAHAKRTEVDAASGGGGYTRIEGIDESRGHSIGVAFDLGFEWFVGRRIALHARTGTTYAHGESESGALRTYYDSSNAVIEQFGFAREAKSNSFDTLEYGLRIVGYF